MTDRRISLVLLICLIALSAAVPCSDALGVDTTETTFRPYTPRSHACRFWAAASIRVPEDSILQHLLTLPYSMLNLSHANPDGWALAHWTDAGGEPDLRRSDTQADQDPLFASSVEWMGALEPRIAMGHIRNCSSGLCDIPNPHLFRRQIEGRVWLFGHNGDISKDLLIELIEPSFLNAHPPEIGGALEEWIDSELYFIYLLQCFSREEWQVKQGLGRAVGALRERIPGDQEYLNFVLSEGESLWAYREGPSAFRLHAEEAGVPFTAVASRYPDLPMDPWIPMENGELVSVSPGGDAVVESIDLYLQPPDDPETPEPASARLWSNYPNPFNPSTRIRFELDEPAWMTLTVFDLRGVRVAQLADGPCDAGRFEIDWEARTNDGDLLPTGIYLLRLRVGEVSVTRKLVLAK